MNDWKVFEGDISQALDEGHYIVADFGEGPDGKSYCIVTQNDDKTPAQLAAEFQAMQDKIKELEADKKQALLF